MAREHPFNVLLSHAEFATLKELALKHGVSQGAILRQALNWRNLMDQKRIPTCANGNPCFVAHLHPTLTAAPAPQELAPNVITPQGEAPAA